MQRFLIYVVSSSTISQCEYIQRNSSSIIGWILDPIALSFTHGRKLTMVLPSTMRTTALKCTALYCTVVNCIALNCSVLNCTAQKGSGLNGVHSNELCTVLYCNQLHSSLLNSITLHCTTLHYTVGTAHSEVIADGDDSVTTGENTQTVQHSYSWSSVVLEELES